MFSQDTNAYLSVLHAAIERHGSPTAIVNDGGGIFRSDRAKAVYAALGIEKLEIEHGQGWQSFIETNFNLSAGSPTARLVGRRGVAEGAQAGEVRHPKPAAPRSPAASTIPLSGGPVVGRG